MSAKKMPAITKETLLRGRNAVKSVMFEELGGELPIRSLTSGQWAEIQALSYNAIKIDTDMGRAYANGGQPSVSFDIAESAKADFEAEVMTCRYGIAFDEQMTVEEVRDMQPAGIVSIIAKEIRIISGVKKEDVSAAVNTFRKK